jgi:hypothetical protein
MNKENKNIYRERQTETRATTKGLQKKRRNKFVHIRIEKEKKNILSFRRKLSEVVELLLAWDPAPVFE